MQVLLPESVTLNGSARVSGDLLVPGTPLVRLNGQPAYGGTLDGGGSASPSSYTVTLNGGAALRHVVRRTDAVALPTVAARRRAHRHAQRRAERARSDRPATSRRSAT